MWERPDDDDDYSGWPFMAAVAVACWAMGVLLG